MNRDDVIRMYLQVSNELCDGKEWYWAGVSKPLERFAALVAAAEREACAKVCEREQTPDEPYYQYDAGYEDGVKDCIAAIRARGAT